ncbi:kinase-like protein [Whalleya microplaca]|nr:kinase-like protein [Whalleya microplaca]
MNHGRRPAFTSEDSSSSLHRSRNTRLEALSTRIIKIRQRADEPEHMFFCYSDLNEIWQADDVREIFYELRSLQQRTLRDELLRFISFLAYIEVKSEWYSNFDRLFFQKPGSSCPILTDRDMPLSEDKLTNLGLPLNKAQRWHEQYSFIPQQIIFNPNDMMQKIEDVRIRLPFMPCGGESAHGGYGDVVFYSLAPDYVVDGHWRRPGWKPPKTEPLAVAVKQFHIQKDGLLEAKNMSLLKESLTKNENISLHEAILTQGVGEEPKVFIIFPRAPYDDLWQFLHGGESTGQRGETRVSYNFASRFPEAADQEFEIAPSLLKQCGDLAGALKFLHQGFRANNVELFCAHMDLKPNNIIIFEAGGDGGSVGMWKLCDFGISAFKEHPHTPGNDQPISIGDYHAQMTMRTRARRDPGPYQAPEVWKFQDTSDLSPQSATDQGRVGRKSDIWSFGAIFAEVFAFALERDKGVKDFADRRLQGLPGRPWDDYFYAAVQQDSLKDPYQHHGDTFKVKPQVVEWLGSLCSRSGTPQRWAECWLGCIKGILQVDPDRRPEAAELEHNIRHPGKLLCYFDSASWDTSQQSPQQHVARPPTTNKPSETLPDIVVTKPSSPTVPNAPKRESISSQLPFNRNIEKKLFSGLLSDDTSVDEGQVEVRQISESQPPLIRSQYRILGRPPDAHGIMTKPDIPRNLGSSKICRLDIPPRKKIIAVATDTERIACLTDSAIRIFKISDCLDTSDLAGFSVPLQVTEPDPHWKGIAISGEFLAVWGVEGKTRDSLLHVVRISDEHHVAHMPIPEDSNIRQFDHDKRVAVSARGFIAIIKSKELFVISYHDGVSMFTLPAPMTPSKGAPEIPTTEREFIDVAFNDEGILLHAWANINNDGALCIYRCSDLHISKRPESIGYYKYDTFEDLHTTRLVPFNTSFGCIVASSDHLYFPAIIQGSVFDQKRALQRHISKELQESNVKSVCMFNNHSLVTVQKAGIWHCQLYEYPLDFSMRHSLGHGVPLCQTKLKPHKSSVMRIITHQNIIYACICHTSGKVEFIPFYPNEGTMDFPGPSG